MTISQSVNTCTNFTSQIEPSNIVEQCNISLVIVNEANERHTLERIFSEYTLPLSINSFTRWALPVVVGVGVTVTDGRVASELLGVASELLGVASELLVGLLMGDGTAQV